MHWLPHNCNVGKATAMSHHSGIESAMFQLIGFSGDMSAKIEYITSTLEKKELKLNANMVTLAKSMHDNYHVLVANVERASDIYSATYYIYKHGKPSKTSPTLLTNMQKAKFEITPNPLPREHDRYYASKSYEFTLKFDGKTLPNHKVELSTLNGFVKEITTDKNGNFKITLPNDFKDVKVGRRANRPSYFILSSSIQSDGKNYHSSFSNPYNVNPTDYWQNIIAGFGTAFFGFFAGLFLYRKVKNG